MFCFLLGAIRRNVMLTNATDSEIQREIVHCLHGAADREGGRAARLKKRAVAASAGCVPGVVQKDVETDADN